MLALALVWRALRPPGGGIERKPSRSPGIVLAAAWAWVGAVYFGRYLAIIDFMAPVYAALFLVQALLLIALGVIRNRVAPGAFGPTAWAGLALFAYAIAGYPLSAALTGDVASTRVVFLTPSPTAVFTLGLLVLAAGRPPLFLAFVPVLWTVAAGVSAWMLDVREDLPLPLIGLGSLALIACKARRPAAR